MSCVPDRAAARLRSDSASDFRPRLTYAITPPNQTTPAERRQALAAAQSARISSLPVGALLVYDVQDESVRNGGPRPFAFTPKVDPLSYAFDELQIGTLPRVVYSAVASHDEASLCRWFDALHARGGLAVLVGPPSCRTTAPLTLAQAFSLAQVSVPRLQFGGVVIPERHQTSGSEDARIWRKVQSGCRFFVSQTIWSVCATKQLLFDLRARLESEGASPPHLLLTFSPCGSQQTLGFMEWLGVAVPGFVSRDLLASRDMLARSIELALEACAEVRAYGRDLGLSVGCNVESVSTRPAEVEAALELVHRIDRLESSRS